MEHTEWELHQKIHMVDSLIEQVETDDRYPWSGSNLEHQDRQFIMDALVMLGEDLNRRLKKI